MRLIENYVAKAEQFLNPIEWIPYVATFSGIARIVAGTVEIAAGVVFAYLKIAYNLLNGPPYFGRTLKEGLLYSLHGCANIGRGVLALSPGFNNLLLVIYDWQIGRFNYPKETLSSDVYPLYTQVQKLLA